MTIERSQTNSLPYKKLFDEIPAYVSIQDRDFRIIEANGRFRDDFGEKPGEFCYEIYKGRDSKCTDCPVEKTFNDGLRHGSEEVIITQQGLEIPVMVHTTPIKDDQERIIAVMEMFTDITEVKLLQEQLRERSDQLRKLFEVVPCYISIQDKDLRLVEANKMFREDFGYPKGYCYEVYKHRDKPCIPCKVKDIFQDGKTYHHEEVVTTKDGRRLNVWVTSVPIKDQNGNVMLVMEMSNNITPIRQLQNQLTSTGLLVGSISHGIKGLLTGLEGGIYMVNSGIKKDDQQRILKGWAMVQRNVERIRNMVMDILYYAKDRQLNWETHKVLSLAREVYDNFTDKAKSLGVEFISRFDPAVGEFEADYQAVRSMLVNILENSFDACRMDKKKSEHKVIFSVGKEADWIIFEVDDNGIGMDRETREKIFSLFFSSKGLGGTGLGLFISNKIVQKHGGFIKVDSREDVGTHFTIKMPIKKPADLESREEEIPMFIKSETS